SKTPKTSGYGVIMSGGASGAPMQCGVGVCRVAFHPMCARLNDLYLQIYLKADGQLSYKGYCQKHTQSKVNAGLATVGHQMGTTTPARSLLGSNASPDYAASTLGQASNKRQKASCSHSGAVSSDILHPH